MTKEWKALNWADRQFPGKPTKKLVLQALLHHHNPSTGRCVGVSVKWISQFACCSDRQVKRDLVALQEDGYLKVVNELGRLNEYVLNFDCEDCVEIGEFMTGDTQSPVRKLPNEEQAELSTGDTQSPVPGTHSPQGSDTQSPGVVTHSPRSGDQLSPGGDTQSPSTTSFLSTTTSGEFPMHLEWVESDTFRYLLLKAGLPSEILTDEARAEFVSFWLSRPDVKRNQQKWENTLLQKLITEHRTPAPTGIRGGTSNGQKTAADRLQENIRTFEEQTDDPTCDYQPAF